MVDYTPEPKSNADDYRCFIVDTPDEEFFVNGWETVPGNRGIVHHVILYSVNDSDLESLRAREARDDRPGYQCFGSAGGSSQFVVGWAPGERPVTLPEGVGVRVSRKRHLVMQVHYNVANGEGSDRTKVNLKLVQGQPTTQLALVPLLQSNLDIPPKSEGVSFSNSFDMPIAVRVWGVFPHMHQLGRSISAGYTHGGASTCMVDIPRWDFNWQGLYLFKEPMVVPAGANIELNCVYDNPTDRQVGWGDESDQEMCLNFFLLEDNLGLAESF